MKDEAAEVDAPTISLYMEIGTCCDCYYAGTVCPRAATNLCDLTSLVFVATPETFTLPQRKES
jgi:hypothetical protein